MEARADVFRINFSDGRQGDHRAVYRRIHALEARLTKPIGLLINLQGPRPRIGSPWNAALH
jgi:pyruvate kinase